MFWILNIPQKSKEKSLCKNSGLSLLNSVTKHINDFFHGSNFADFSDCCRIWSGGPVMTYIKSELIHKRIQGN